MTNKEGIKRLMAYYNFARKNYFSKSDALNMVTKHSSAGLGDKETTYCYGMSKMTVTNEVKNYG